MTLTQKLQIQIPTTARNGANKKKWKATDQQRCWIGREAVLRWGSGANMTNIAYFQQKHQA